MDAVAGCEWPEPEVPGGRELFRVSDLLGHSDGQDTPSVRTGRIEVVDLEGDDRMGDGGAELRSLAGEEDDVLAEERVVHREDRRERRHGDRDAPDGAPPQQVMTLFRGEDLQSVVDEGHAVSI